MAGILGNLTLNSYFSFTFSVNIAQGKLKMRVKLRIVSYPSTVIFVLDAEKNYFVETALLTPT